MDRLPIHPAQHVENRKLNQRHRTPQRQPLQLVIALMPINAKQMLLQLSRILADEIWNDETVQNWMKDIHAPIVHRNAFNSILRTNANEMLFASPQQFNRFDDDRRINALESKDWFLSGLFQLFIGDVFAACETGRNQAEHARTGAGGDKIAAGEFHEQS